MDNTRINNIKLVTVITVIIVFMLSSTYAFLEFRQVKNITGTETGCFEVNYTAQAINASDLVSTTNYAQGARSQVVLSNLGMLNPVIYFMFSRSISNESDMCLGSLTLIKISGTLL